MTEPDTGEPAWSGAPPARAPLPQWWWDLSLRRRRFVAAGLVAVAALALAYGVGRAIGTGGGEPTAAQQAAEFVAELSPDRVATWDRLAECESESQWDLDTGNGYYGGLQFALVSWEEVGGVGNPAHTTREEQIMRGESLYERQGWGAWPRCSAQLGLQ